MCWNGFFMFSIDLQGICSQYAVCLSMRVILCESVDVCVWTTRSVVSTKKEWVYLLNLAMAPKCLNDSRFLMFVVETNSITRWDQGNVINARGREYSMPLFLLSLLSFLFPLLHDCSTGRLWPRAASAPSKEQLINLSNKSRFTVLLLSGTVKLWW